MTESQKLEEKLKQMMRFEDNDTLFIRVVPKETRIS